VIKNFWWALRFSSEITAVPSVVRWFGRDFAAWRDAQGGPHLSLGDSTFDALDRYGFLWAFIGDRDLPENERPPIPTWPEFDDPTFRATPGTFSFDANYERVVENGIDMAHTPFVHHGFIGTRDQPEIPDYSVVESEWSGEATVTLRPVPPSGVFRYINKVRKDVVTTNAWYAPSLLKIDIALPLGRLVIYDSNIPIDDSHTLVRWVVLRNFLTGAWADGSSRKRTLRIFDQDRPIVEAQRPELLPFDLSAELHVKSDAMTLSFRRMRDRCLERGWLTKETVS